MPFNDLREWIAALDRAGELKRIQTEVDPILEITEITDRVSKGKPHVETAALRQAQGRLSAVQALGEARRNLSPCQARPYWGRPIFFSSAA